MEALPGVQRLCLQNHTVWGLGGGLDLGILGSGDDSVVWDTSLSEPHSCVE